MLIHRSSLGPPAASWRRRPTHHKLGARAARRLPPAWAARSSRHPAQHNCDRGLFVAACASGRGIPSHRVLADAEDDRDRLALAADLVRRRVAVIAAPANASALAAKAATATGTGTTSSTMSST